MLCHLCRGRYWVAGLPAVMLLYMSPVVPSFSVVMAERCRREHRPCDGRALSLQKLRVRWALQKDHKHDSTPTIQIFVGGLASDVNDRLLLSSFLPFGCVNARVMWDHNTGQATIANMTRAMLGSQRIRCRWAQHRQDTFWTSCHSTVLLQMG